MTWAMTVSKPGAGSLIWLVVTRTHLGGCCVGLRSSARAGMRIYWRVNKGGAQSFSNEIRPVFAHTPAVDKYLSAVLTILARIFQALTQFFTISCFWHPARVRLVFRRRETILLRICINAASTLGRARL